MSMECTLLHKLFGFVLTHFFCLFNNKIDSGSLLIRWIFVFAQKSFNCNAHLCTDAFPHIPINTNIVFYTNSEFFRYLLKNIIFIKFFCRFI